jgi:branched-chain amino acid transport system ATP-binding protein
MVKPGNGLGDNLLTVESLSVRFGGILALDGVNFSIKQGSITALIGPNGAGKTTVFNCLTGFYRPTEGKLFFGTGHGRQDIVKILGEPFAAGDFINPRRFASRVYYKMFGGTHLVARAGIARTFQNIRLFSEMTVIENLLVAQHLQISQNILSGLFLTKSYRESERSAVEQAYRWAEIVGLAADGNRLASELPYGHQRRLEIARAMCIQPKLICLDEPAAGLNPRETNDLSQLIRQLREKFGVTVFVIEHDMGLVMEISDQVVVLNYGKVIASGLPKEIQSSPAVLAAYLGTESEELNGTH